MSTTVSRKVLLVAWMAMLAAGCDQAVEPTAGEPAAPAAAAAPAPAAAAAAATPVPETDRAKAAERRVTDLIAIHAALEAFHAKNGQYPAARDGLKSVVDRGADWIPGLAPEFIAELPRDPLVHPTNEGPQYLYVSNTKGYKLIAVTGNSGRCSPEMEKDGIRIDPARTNEVGCWGFGFWTDDYEKF